MDRIWSDLPVIMPENPKKSRNAMLKDIRVYADRAEGEPRNRNRCKHLSEELAVYLPPAVNGDDRHEIDAHRETGIGAPAHGAQPSFGRRYVALETCMYFRRTHAP